MKRTNINYNNSLLRRHKSGVLTHVTWEAAFKSNSSAADAESERQVKFAADYMSSERKFISQIKQKCSSRM